MINKMVTTSTAHYDQVSSLSSTVQSRSLLEDDHTDIIRETTNTSYPLVFVDNDIERWATGIAVFMIIVWTLLANSLIVFLVIKKWKVDHMQCSYYVITAAVAIWDASASMSGGLIGMTLLFMELETPYLFCRIVSDIAIISYFNIIYTIGMMAVERYFFFCKPFKYARIFTTKNAIIAISMPYAFVFAYVIGTEVIIGRIVFVNNLHCQLENARVHSVIQLLTIFGPTVFAVLFSSVKIKLLIREQERRMPHVSTISDELSVTTLNNMSSSTIAKKAASSVKLVFLLSGILFGTHVPIYVTRALIFASGVTLDDIETRRRYIPAIVMRIESLTGCILSPALNPVIFFAINTQLRQWLVNNFRRNTNVSPFPHY